MSQKSRNRRAHGREDTTASPAGCGDTARTRTAAVPRGQLKGKRKVLAEPSGAEALTVAKRRRKEGEAVEGGGAGSLGEAVRQARLRVAPSVQEFKYNKKRVRLVSESSDLKDAAKGVVYWMSRDQRVQDNWAFLYAQRLALKQQLPLHVCFCLVPKFLEATIRHFGFMLKGLQEVAEECQELDIPFHLLIGFAKDVLPAFVTDRGLGGVVTDFSPLRVPMQWVEDVKERLLGDVPFVQVDAHNIVPCWVTSDKQEYGARTIRRKIHDRLPEFLTEFPPVIKHPFPPTAPAEPIDWSACRASLQVDCSVKEVRWAMPGTAAGLAMLESFIGERLKSFGTDRNNPTRAALSNLSPWFHFGLRPAGHPGGAEIPQSVQGVGGWVHRGGRGPEGAGRQLLLLQQELRQGGRCVRLGQNHPEAPRPRQEVSPLRAEAAGGGEDARPALERCPAPDGSRGEDARVPTHVLGQENPGVDPLPRGGPEVRHLPQRSL
ncbi:deoxyribodipyrimidine photo-lyase-like isoform X4 [Lepidochelys kempii]|uniref:deoxyribodipyrimidine photo-lyase-like isoform X4 n=1 Tax=Lepidochelys kempii TaxID=8472 RepID=UPI003C6F5C1A